MSDATFVTVSDSRYFLGTVGLVNSLRLVGHADRALILDAGLESWQRDLLTRACDIVAIPDELHGIGRDSRFGRSLLKPYVRELDLTGTVVLIDSDMIVTGPLTDILGEAARGRICAFPAQSVPSRWFAEWEQLLDLAAPPRRQVYVNAGFVALSLDHWTGLIGRWWQACLRFPTVQAQLPPERSLSRNPLAIPDQDALNAILMSEIPEDALALQDPDLEPTTYHRGTISVVDAETLECVYRGRQTLLLHHLDRPKPWEPSGGARLRFEAYTELLSRLLDGGSLAISVPPASQPLWLRQGLSGRMSRRALGTLGRLVDRLLRARWQLRRRRRSHAGHAWSVTLAGSLEGCPRAVEGNPGGKGALSQHPGLAGEVEHRRGRPWQRPDVDDRTDLRRELAGDLVDPARIRSTVEVRTRRGHESDLVEDRTGIRGELWHADPDRAGAIAAEPAKPLRRVRQNERVGPR